MHFRHAPATWQAFPELRAAALAAHGLHRDVDAAAAIDAFEARARERLAAAGSESELPEVQAWRRAFGRMGLKPTQYRCASESLLRRLRKEGSLPRIHLLIDLCNAASVAFAIPVAALDVTRIAWPLEVRPATGSEVYEAFSGDHEHPDPGEIVFADAQGRAHARRWTHRQSGLSAVRDATTDVFIVAEALHADAAADTARLGEELAQAIRDVWGVEVRVAAVRAESPVFAG